MRFSKIIIHPYKLLKVIKILEKHIFPRANVLKSSKVIENLQVPSRIGTKFSCQFDSGLQDFGVPCLIGIEIFVPIQLGNTRFWSPKTNRRPQIFFSCLFFVLGFQNLEVPSRIGKKISCQFDLGLRDFEVPSRIGIEIFVPIRLGTWKSSSPDSNWHEIFVSIRLGTSRFW